MTLTHEQLEAFVEDLAANPDCWRHLLNHDPERRTYGLISDSEDVNAWVLCWSSDQDTGFHDHDISAAAITVIEGQVREDRLRLDGSAREIVYSAGSTFTVPPEAIHRVLHSGESPAVTIHAYSPPLRRQGAYAIGEEGTLQRHVQAWEEELVGQDLISAA
jgi:quercetin dioxygenase-like cupin family protein